MGVHPRSVTSMRDTPMEIGQQSEYVRQTETDVSFMAHHTDSTAFRCAKARRLWASDLHSDTHALSLPLNRSLRGHPTRLVRTIQTAEPHLTHTTHTHTPHTSHSN